MRYLDYVGIFLGNDLRQSAKLAWLVLDRNRQPRQTAIANETTIDNSAEQCDVDVASGNDRDGDVI